MKSSFSFVNVIVGAFITVVALVIAIVIVSSWPSSSSGVRTINDYEANIGAGDTLVLTNLQGKTTHVWKITYDGENTVTAIDTTAMFGFTSTGHLCGEGCTTSLDAGWFQSLTLTQIANARVDVKWPFGWGYQRNGSQ